MGLTLTSHALYDLVFFLAIIFVIILFLVLLGRLSSGGMPQGHLSFSGALFMIMLANLYFYARGIM